MRKRPLRTVSRCGPASAPFSSSNQRAGVCRNPSLFTAIEEQLGVKLQPAQTVRTHLVIEHIERPTRELSPPQVSVRTLTM
jgi:uncharacterized protein (TIGR03435 family)